MSSLPILLIVLAASAVCRILAEWSSQRPPRHVAPGETPVGEEPPGIYVTTLRQPPDEGTNQLVVDSLMFTLVGILRDFLPQAPPAKRGSAPDDIQLSLALLPGRRHLYRLDVMPGRFQEEIARVLEPRLQRLPRLPLEAGSFFVTCRVHVRPGRSVYPPPFLGVVDQHSQRTWETQIEQALTGPAAVRDDSGMTPEDCQRLLELAPDNRVALWLQGILYRTSDQPERALDVFSQLTPLPQWPHAHLARAEILLGQGRATEALVDLDTFLQHDPESLLAHLFRADALRMSGDLAAAGAAADRAIELDPLNSRAHLARAQVAAAGEDHRGAVQHATTAHLRNPPDPIPLLFRAEQYAILGEFSEALGDLDVLEVAAADWVPARGLRAQILFANQNFVACAELLTELLKQEERIPWLLLRGRAFAASGKLELAQADFSRVLDLNPRNGEARFYRAHVSFELNRLDEAAADLAEVIVHGIQLAEAHYLRGVIALRQDETETAREEFDQALVENPLHCQTLLQRSQLCLQQEDGPGALRDLDVAIGAYPESIEAWCQRGETRRMLGNIPAALEDFDTALERAPDNPAARFGRARVLVDQGQARQALAEVHQVVELSPDWPEPRLFRVNLALLLGQPELALADLRELRDNVRASDTPIQLILEVQALLASDRYDELIARCKELLAATPDFGMAWVWHGQALVYRDGPDAGRESFQQALELGPEHAEFITTEQRLAAATYHTRREEFDEVLRLTTELLDEDANSLPARHLRGGAYWYSQQLVEAVEDYSAILQDHPGQTQLRSCRGQVLAELGDTDAALPDLNQAIAELEQAGDNESLAYALSGRALTAIVQEEMDAAEADLNRSLCLAPTNAWSMYHRGLWHHARGEPQSAGWCFRLALRLTEPALPPHKRAKARAYVAGLPQTGADAPGS